MTPNIDPPDPGEYGPEVQPCDSLQCAGWAEVPDEDSDELGGYCPDCIRAMPLCRTEGHDGWWSFQEWYEWALDVRPWDEAHLHIGECPDCGSTVSWLMTSHPEYDTWMRERGRPVGLPVAVAA